MDEVIPGKSVCPDVKKKKKGKARQRKRGQVSCSVFGAQFTCSLLQADLRDVNWKNYSCSKHLQSVCHVADIYGGSVMYQVLF